MRGDRQGARLSLILALVFPAMVGAALALAYYGYGYVAKIVSTNEASLREQNAQAADDLIKGIQKRVDEADNALFAAIELSYAPDTGAAELKTPDELPPGIESFVVLDARQRVVNRKSAYPIWEKYLSNLKLDWNSVQPAPESQPAKFSYRHLHQLFEGQSLNIVYGRKRTAEGKDYYVAAKFDLGLLRRDWIPREVRELKGSRRIVILDEQWGVVYGRHLPQRDERYMSESSFGKNFYAWRIQLAPENVDELIAQARRSTILGRALVPISLGIMAVGLAVVFMAVRAERRASRLKSEFIANVSHELKTPLSLIRMFGELLATGRHKGEGTAREYADIITRESERLSHLIDNVLDFARLERGKASYDFAEGSLADVVERTLDVCRYRVEKEKLRLVTFIEPELPPVRMDENAMTLALLNLVDNAVKYGADGGEVEVSLRRAPGGLALSVRDRGPGIAADEQHRIFERFYRSRSARDKNVRGSGIGLSLVKHIAEAHGGRVEVVSEPGAGATFRVFVPAAPVVAEGTPAPVVAEGTPAPVVAEATPVPVVAESTPAPVTVTAAGAGVVKS